MSNDLLKLLFYSQKQVNYMPELVPIAGGVNATILLLRILYWHTKQEGQTFYKFEKFCKHKEYRTGDSWTEELGFSVEEFRNARAKIGTKQSKPVTEMPVQTITGEYLGREHLVYYYTDYHRKTWYTLNINLLVYYLSQQNESIKMPVDPKLKKVIDRTDADVEKIEAAELPKTANFTLLEEKVKTWVKVVQLRPAIVQTLNTALVWYDPRTETRQSSTPNQLYDDDIAYRDWINQEVEPALARMTSKKSGRAGYTQVSQKLTQYVAFTDFIRKNLQKYLLQKDTPAKNYVPVMLEDDEDDE